MKINNITKYKQSKIITKDLENIIDIIKQTINQLNGYKKYYGVQESLVILDDCKTILTIHLNKHKRILDTKGEVD